MARPRHAAQGRSEVTLGELEVWAQNARKRGHDWIQLVVVRKTKPRTNRIRLMPGLYGTVVGPLSQNRYLVDLAAKDAERRLAAEHGNGDGGLDGNE